MNVIIGYDLHLIVDALNSKLVSSEDINIIAKNAEKFVGMEITGREKLPPLKQDYSQSSGYIKCRKNNRIKVRFLDSLQFMPSSLDALVKNIRKTGLENLDVVKSGFSRLMPGFTEPTLEELDLFTKKHFFPYSFLDHVGKFHPSVQIPGRDSFFNDLTNESISDKNWERTQKVISTFNLKNFNDYARFYCCSDTLLLAQVWVNYARQGMSSFGLDPAYVYSCPSYSYQCCFYFTKAKLDCIKNKKMLNLIQSGLRGGPCFANVKKTEAKTERFGHKIIDPNERQHLIYFDITALYSSCLSGPLPHSNFKYIKKRSKLRELKKLDWSKFDENGDIGYLIKCRLLYPREIHGQTQFLPLAPEHREISIDDLSIEQISLVEKLNLKGVFTKINQKRLLMTCYDKEEYTLNHFALKYYISQGMVLDKVYEAMSFNQSAVFEPYITKNLQFRAQAKNEFEVMYFKLMNNR